MAYKDLREFINACKEANDYIEIDRAVKADCEIGWALKKSYANEAPVMMFNNIVDNEGRKKKYSAVAGIYGNRAKAIKAFETTPENIHQKFITGLNNPISPIMVDLAPCQEVVIPGEDVDLNDYPIPRFSSLDGGYFITAGITVSKDPETGIRDIGHYRYMIQGKNILGWMAQPFHRFGKNTYKSVRMGKDKIQAAIIIGVDPVIAYTCPIKGIPDSVDDWDLAGGLRGEAVPLVKCKTIDMEVPATAEFVIELEVDLLHTMPEGPLGEFTGYFSPAENRFVSTIKCITHRKNPVFQILMTGKPQPVTENHVLKSIPFEASFFNYLKKQFPSVTDVSVPCSGGVQEWCVIAMKPRYAGEPRHVALYAMANDMRPKWVIVVDPDIDIHNSAEVEWALSYRTQPKRDVFIIPDVPGGPADPSNRLGNGKMASLNDSIGIDATCPFGTDYATVADAPGWENYDFPELNR